MIDVISPTGEHGSIPAAQAQEALDAGFEVSTAEQRREYDLEQKYGDGLSTVRAGVEGVARGASFGLSDLIMSKLGADTEGLRERKERNPIAATAGELGSLVLNPLGEAGIAARLFGKSAKLADTAGKVIGYAPAALAKASLGAEKAIAGVIGESLLAKSAAKAVTTAVEAEAYNIAKNISEASLGDEKITTERLLAGSGDALKIGAGLGFAMPIASRAIEIAGQSALTKAQELSTYVREHVFKSAAEAYAGVAAKVASRSSAATEVEIKTQFLAKAGTEEGLASRLPLIKGVTAEERDTIAREMFERAKSTVDELKNAEKTAFNQARPREIDTLLEGANDEIAKAKAINLLRSAQDTVREMLDDPAIYSQSGIIRKTALLVEKMAKDFETTPFNAQELFAYIDDFKRAMDKQVGKYGKNIAPEAMDTVEKVSGLRGAFKSFLEDEEAWGAAAARQQSFNEAYNFYRTAKTEFYKKFGEDTVTRSGKKVKQLTPVKFNTYMNQIGAARGDGRDRALTTFLEASEGFAAQIKQSADTAFVPFDETGVKSLVEKALKQRGDAMEKLETMSKLRALDNGASFVAAMQQTNGLAGMMGIGGPAVAGITATIKNMASAESAVRVLAVAESFALQTSKIIEKAATTFVQKSASAAGRLPFDRAAGVFAGKIADGRTGGAFAESDDKQDTFEARYKEIADIVADPAAYAAKFDEGLLAMEQHAPNTKRAIVTKQLQIAQFLYDRAPRDMQAGTKINPFAQKAQPSDAAISKWNRYYKAARDPMSVVREINRGNISREGVETLRVLYPAVFEDIKAAFSGQISQMKEVLPYGDRIAIGTLFGIPTDPTLAIDFLKTMSQITSQNVADDRNLSVSGSVDLAKNHQTTSQRIASK